jgi:hypothetical protein
VSATIRAACDAFAAGFNFLCTAQGQELVALMLKDGAKAKQTASDAWSEVKQLLHG